MKRGNTKVEDYKERELPSNQGVILEPLKGNHKSAVPKEALAESIEAESHPKDPSAKRDPFNEDRVARHTPPVDSSEETLGG